MYYFLGVFPRFWGFSVGLFKCTVVRGGGIGDRGPRVKKGKNGAKSNTKV